MRPSPAVIAFVVTVIWGLTGGGYFWPMWVWLGISLPLGVALTPSRASDDRRAGPERCSGSTVGLMPLVDRGARGVGADRRRAGPFWPVLVGARVLAARPARGSSRGRVSPERERELTERVDELTRTRRGALDVQAAELRRIERDLHDGAQARLVALSMQLGRAEERLGRPPEVAELVRRARGEASAAIAELRDLARGIAPPVLADRGLARGGRGARAARRRCRSTVDVARRRAGRCRSSRPPPTSSSPRR